MILDATIRGAVGNGATDNTAILQRCIDQCHAGGGGTVILRAGVFLSYTLTLKSNVTFQIDAGATLLGGTDPMLYPEIPDTPVWRPQRGSRGNRRTLLYAENAENIALKGRGRIDGQGPSFMIQDNGHYELLQHWKRRHDRKIPGRTILFVGCRDLLIEDVLIFNAAGWSMWILDCDRVQIERVRIDCDFRVPNVDGIHVSASRDVTIGNCLIRSSDDALILRAHQEQLFRPKPCERISVSNCVLKSGSSAVRIGWSNDYEIRQAVFSNLVIEHSFAGFSVLIPEVTDNQYDPPRFPGMPWIPPEPEPFTAEDISFDHIEMEVETAMILIKTAPSAPVRTIRNLRFSNIHALCGGYPFIQAAPAQQVRDISFDNVSLEIRPPKRKDLVNYRCFRETMEWNHVKNLSFDRFHILHGITPDGGHRKE